ncbi:SMP-30/gluconolactonase/LRE family protein [Aquibacillus koreensis]|uniref:SMP-30/gluconolactonase/LRE family protein n=1 Tax=Aquibacillus koreensis TaxID=279446 RepID=A0A9X4ALS5_9BACI|nr:SMP-30/gluconolactonase/LRE family protein [Aquibacillus koreensis]MCT2535258.1 SMP-30/gluconolactonase/LRE family protein [Aquibacillus koreensis]MDC3422783.1 SMP-30/gluconolactonase/LRE family protein [Aquibacillus koreensis]
MTVELVFNTKSQLGEGPSWDHKRNLFYWVDILGKKVFQYSPSSNERYELLLDQYCGFVVPRENGGVVLGLQNGIHFYDWEKDQLEKITDPESHLPNNRFNDGKCDPTGRLWAGTMDLNAKDGMASLYTLDSHLHSNKKLGNLGISNGLAWSPDHSYMYFIDTPTKQIVQYDFDKNTGSIDQPKVVVDFHDQVGSPDGMTIDSEGMLWIAHWGGHGVSRWDPNTGEQLAFVDIPAKNVTSCAFGGEDLNQLYVTTARTDTSEEELENYPHAGGVFKFETNVKGSRTYAFKG